MDRYLDHIRQGWHAPDISRRVHRFPQLPVSKEGRQTGYASSITWSPYLRKMIGFGRVEKEFAEPETSLLLEREVEGERGEVGATVVKLPFVKLKRSV